MKMPPTSVKQSNNTTLDYDMWMWPCAFYYYHYGCLSQFPVQLMNGLQRLYVIIRTVRFQWEQTDLMFLSAVPIVLIINPAWSRQHLQSETWTISEKWAALALTVSSEGSQEPSEWNMWTLVSKKTHTCTFYHPSEKKKKTIKEEKLSTLNYCSTDVISSLVCSKCVCSCVPDVSAFDLIKTSWLSNIFRF